MYASLLCDRLSEAISESKMKRILIIITAALFALQGWAQIPRMLKDPWYKELKANLKNLNYSSDDDEGALMDGEGDVISAMREAYNAHAWLEVDSLFELAHSEVSDNMNIYNWERTALRHLVQETEQTAETMHRLMQLYDSRRSAGLPDDMPYQYGNNRQWNMEQRLVDYVTYVGRRIDVQTQYDFINEGIASLERPLNAIVLCQMMDLTMSDATLSDEEFNGRLEELVQEAHSTRDWLNDNFLTLEMQTTSQMLQALEQREMRWRKDSRCQAAALLEREQMEEARLKNSFSNEERAQYYLLQAGKALAEKDYDKAVEMIQQSLAENQDNPVAYLRLAECYTANAQVTGRVGNFLDKFASQFAAVAAMDMLHENMHSVQSQQGRSAISTQIDQLRRFVNQHPLYKQDLFRMGMGFGDTVRLNSYIRRTITLRERY